MGEGFHGGAPAIQQRRRSTGGLTAFLGLTAAVATHTLPFAAAFATFTNEIIWLIVISFFALGFIKTGLGDRVVTYFVKWLGSSTLGLSYGLTLGEACIAPVMPSTVARAGGIFLPIIKSLSLLAGSKPNHPSSRKLRTYLVMSQFQSFRSLQGLLQDIQQIAGRTLLLWLWKGMRKLPNEVWVLLKVLVVSAWLLCFLLSEDACLSPLS